MGRAYAPVRAGLNEPLISQNAVLFPVAHGQEVVNNKQSIQKMQELAKRGATIWHEGNEAENVVVRFLKQSELHQLPLRSWEPEAHGKQITPQGALLNDIFGGKTKRMLYMMYSHPNVAEPMIQAGHQIKTNDNKETSQVQWNAQSGHRPTILEVYRQFG